MTSTNAPSSVAKLFYGFAFILLITLPCSVLGVRLGIWDYAIGLMLCTVSLAGSFILQIMLSIWLLRKPEMATKRLLRKTSLIALPPLLVAAMVIRQSGDKPMIHDISTDTEQPPEFVFLLSERGASSNDLTIKPEVISAQRRAYPQLKPVITNYSVTEAITRAKVVCEELGWDIYQIDKPQGRIEATATTQWFAFIDDIVIRVKPHPQGSVVDLRSVSRVGEGDLGANARRIEAFIRAYHSLSN
jgi:uncharacterized protein (DUF1499 family)